MRILASPARRNRKRNPFNFLLSEELAARGCEVVDLDDRNGFSGRWDVFHIHWPQEVARGRGRRPLQRTANLIAHLAVLRLRGTRVVWTVHNAISHDRHNMALERVLMWFVVRLVSGVVFLTASSRADACEAIPAVRSKPFAVIPHGLYGMRSGKSRREARLMFGLPQDRPIVAFLGDIKRYKGLDLLMRAIGQLRPQDATLFVAGVFEHSVVPQQREYAALIRARMAELSAQGYSIVFREERLDDVSFADAIRASDVVSLPYREAWNSGLALLALENRARILASDAPVFRELQQEVGSRWVQLFDDDFTGDALLAALSGGTDEAPDRLEAFAAARNWSKIGTETLAFYRRLGVESGGSTITIEPASEARSVEREEA